jgi:hypothetical protein
MADGAFSMGLMVRLMADGVFSMWLMVRLMADVVFSMGLMDDGVLYVVDDGC